MELSGLTSDAKFLLAKELPTKDLLSLCSTDSNMRRICISERFNPIWSQKLKEDYNIDYHGSNGYMEYMLNTYVLKQVYYAAIIYYTQGLEIDYVFLCKTRDEGYNLLKEKLDEMYGDGTIDDSLSYLQIKMILQVSGEINIENRFKIWLQEATFGHSSEGNSHKETYDDRLEEIATLLFPNDLDRREKFIKYEFEETVQRAVAFYDDFDVYDILDKLEKSFPNIRDNDDVPGLLIDILGQ